MYVEGTWIGKEGVEYEDARQTESKQVRSILAMDPRKV